MSLTIFPRTWTKENFNQVVVQRQHNVVRHLRTTSSTIRYCIRELPMCHNHCDCARFLACQVMGYCTDTCRSTCSCLRRLNNDGNNGVMNNFDTKMTNKCYSGLVGLGTALNAQGSYCLGVASEICGSESHHVMKTCSTALTSLCTV
jgi:hypothetical protein